MLELKLGARSGGLLNAHQFTIEATSVAIELIVKATAPQRSVSGTAVGALGLGTSRSGVGGGLITSETRAGDVGRASILRLDAQGGPLARLGVDSGEGRELVHGRSERSKGSHIREGRGGGRSISLLRLVGGNRLHVNILGLEVLMETCCRRPRARRFNCCEEFVKRQLNRWADDIEVIGVVQRQTFSKTDRIRAGRSGMVQGTGVEVVREKGRETEGGGGLVILADNWLSGVRGLAAALGQGGFFVIVIRNLVDDRRGSSAGRFVKLGGGLQIWLLDWTRHGSRSGLVDAKGKLHALDGSWSTVEASLAVALLLSSTLLDHISRVVPFESRSFEFDDTPAKVASQPRVGKINKKDITCLPFSLSSLSPMCLESLLNSRLERALSESTIRFWRCHSLQLRFSSLWPCSRKLATFVQT